MVKGKCDNCKNKATTEWLITTLSNSKSRFGSARTMKWCDNCKPKHIINNIQLIEGK